MTTKTENPLLGIDFEVPFDAITAAHVQPAIGTLISEARSAIDAIANASGPRTYANTLEALEAATVRLEISSTVVSHLESVRSHPELREAYNAVQPLVSSFYASVPLNEGLYKALRAFSETAEAEQLSATKKRLLKKTLDDFRRHGAELPASGKARLQAIIHELAEVTNKFSQNLLDSTAAWELVIEDEARLAGLPESARAQARSSAEAKKKTGFRFTLQAPSVVPALTYLDDASLRETIYRAYNRRASGGEFDNQALILRILELRAEKAELLGYRDFSDLVLEDRMAKTGEAAQQFVRDLEARTRAAFEREKVELYQFRCSLEGASAPELEPWDVAYYAEKQRKALYDFDEEELRPYFPADAVMRGLFETAARLYEVRVEVDQKMPRWHADVQCYRLFEGETFLGAFYVDLYPREEKRGGAWMNGLITGGPGVGGHPGFHPHLGLICANITPPLGDKPALLTHDEVQTLFHEFGHLLHHLLSRVEVRSLGGTNVAWDFVELPSQIMENWCWEREALNLFAHHAETGAPIPDALFLKMKRARTFREATATMRQLGFATVDLRLHRDFDPARDGDVVAFSNRVLEAYAPARYPPDYAFITGFSHLFSSGVAYAAGYYSYKWAEVLDADAFSRFLEEGVFSRDVGLAFRRAVLERGDSDEPMKLFQAFRGREPTVDALLRRSGLISTEPTSPA